MTNLLIKFKPDNFTSIHRTPWAGTQISSLIKAHLSCPVPNRIGESWEFSTAAELPSICSTTFDGAFSDFLKLPSNRDLWLSKSHQNRWGSSSPMLVKYLGADINLSVQLHPPICHPSLGAGESGSWESWLILSSTPGAGVYLGFEDGVSCEDFIQAIHHKIDARPLLHFVPVQTGEFYTIPPCTVHALGAGVCALETQIIQPGKKALSLRLHDWNHTYDQNGQLSPAGSSRELHLDKALSHFDSCAPQGSLLESQNRVQPVHLVNSSEFSVKRYSLKPWLEAMVLNGSGHFDNLYCGEMTFIAVVSGTAEITVDGQAYHMTAGESGVIAASAQSCRLNCQQAHVYLSHCIPDVYDDRFEF